MFCLHYPKLRKMIIFRVRVKTKVQGVGTHLQRPNHIVKDLFWDSCFIYIVTQELRIVALNFKNIYIDIQNYYKVFIKSLVKYRSQNVFPSVSRLHVESLCLLVCGVESSVVSQWLVTDGRVGVIGCRGVRVPHREGRHGCD